MRVLMTAGATREPLDPVRFLSNASSGRMAAEIAREARARRHSVQIVAGFAEAPMPPGVPVQRVCTARQMLARARRSLIAFRPDVVLGCAAVSDYRPARRFCRKMPSGRRISLPLVPNPDILASLASDSRRLRRRPFFVGFSLETAKGSAAVRRARAKARRKHLDLVVVNPPETIGSERVRAVFLNGNGQRIRRLPAMSKRRFARILWDAIESRIR